MIVERFLSGGGTIGSSCCRYSIIAGDTVSVLRVFDKSVCIAFNGGLFLTTSGKRTRIVRETLNRILDSSGSKWRIIQRKWEFYLVNTESKDKIPFQEGWKVVDKAN